MDDVIKSIHCPTCDLRHAPCFDQKRLCKRFVSTRLLACCTSRPEPNLTGSLGSAKCAVSTHTGLPAYPLEHRY